MLSPAEKFEHPAGMLGIGWLAENMARAFGHGVASKNDSPLDAGRDIGRFLIGHVRGELRGRLAAAHPTLGAGRGRHDREAVAGFGQ